MAAPTGNTGIVAGTVGCSDVVAGALRSAYIMRSTAGDALTMAYSGRYAMVFTDAQAFTGADRRAMGDALALADGLPMALAEGLSH